jgi:hypothetical protein
MPRLARNSGQWFALAEDFPAIAYLLRRRHAGPSLLSPVRVFGREFIHKRRGSVNKKITLSDQWLRFGLGGFDPRDIDSEMMGEL